jgi:hypothetical protein
MRELFAGSKICIVRFGSGTGCHEFTEILDFESNPPTPLPGTRSYIYVIYVINITYVIYVPPAIVYLKL